jgi:hypothetical protein
MSNQIEPVLGSIDLTIEEVEALVDTLSATLIMDIPNKVELRDLRMGYTALKRALVQANAAHSSGPQAK